MCKNVGCVRKNNGNANTLPLNNYYSSITLSAV